MSIFSIALIILLSLLLLAFFVFTMLFILQRFYIKKEQHIKEEYNEIAVFSISGGLNYLEALSKNNKQLEGIVFNIIEANKFYKHQANNLKTKIIKLTEFNRKFKFYVSSKLIKQLNVDLANCHYLHDNIYNLYNTTTDYTDSTRAILTKYKIVFDIINDFYINNLLSKFDKPILAQLSKEIKSLLTDCNSNLIKINNQKAIESINQINEKCVSYYALIKTLYVYLQAFFYLTKSKQTLEELFKKNNKMLFEKECHDVEKVIVNARIDLQDLNESINNLDFDRSFELIKIISQQVEPTVNIFKENDRINLALQMSIQFIGQVFELWTNNYFSLKNNFKDISNYFSEYNDNEIGKKVDKLAENYKKMQMKFDLLFKQSKKTNYYDRINFLKDILNFYKEVVVWQNNITNLWKDITDKYQSSIILINDLFDLQWTFVQLKSFKNAIDNPSHQDTINSIDQNLNKINELIVLINKNYAYNYEYVTKEIKTLKQLVISYYNACSLDNMMRYYLRCLIFSANKYRHEDKMIEASIQEAEKLYKDKKYTEGFDTLYKTLEHIKDSAKINHVKYN